MGGMLFEVVGMRVDSISPVDRDPSVFELERFPGDSWP
jgi:hypothetical protein